MDEFREAMKRSMGAEVDDKELEIIFMKVDTNCDGTVDWVSVCLEIFQRQQNRS